MNESIDVVILHKHQEDWPVATGPGEVLITRILFSRVKFEFLKIMLVKKQMKYFDVPLDQAWKVPVLQELLNTRMNNLYVEGFDDYVITEMINMLCNE